MRLLREIWRGALSIEWANVLSTGPLRVALIITGLVAWCCVAGKMSYVPAVALGPLFSAGLGDPGGADRSRLFYLVFGTFAMTLSVFLGGSVANNLALHLVTISLFAFVCGFATLAGPRAELLGVLCLVLFSIFSGTPELTKGAFLQATLFFLSSLVALVFVLAPWVTRRSGGLRIEGAKVFRGFAYAAKGTEGELIATIHAERLRTVRYGLELDGLQGPSAQWFLSIVDEGNDLRLALIGLAAEHQKLEPGAPQDALREFLLACGVVCEDIANTLVWKWRGRRIAEHLKKVQRAQAACALFPELISPMLLSSASKSLGEIGMQLKGPWPLGSGNGVALPKLRMTAPPSIRVHLHLSDESFRHALRLTIAIFIGSVVGHLFDLQHSYWIPMTIAWISKPGQGDTAQRLFSRLLGTVVGVLIAIAIFEIFHPGDWGIVAILGVTSFVILVFILANYAICIIGLSIFVLFLFASQDDSILLTGPARIGFTAIAALIVALCTLLWPSRKSGSVCGNLGQLAQSLRFYIDALQVRNTSSKTAVDQARSAVLEARITAERSITEAAHEPGFHRLTVEDSKAILQQFNIVTADLVAVEFTEQIRNNESDLHNLSQELAQVQEEITIINGDQDRAKRPMARLSALHSDSPLEKFRGSCDIIRHDATESS